MKQRVERHCKDIVNLKGEGSFHVQSTKRQFQRYIDYWTEEAWQENWRPIAKAAVKALSPPGEPDRRELPQYA